MGEWVKKHRENGGARYRECIAWVMEELYTAVKKGYIPTPIAAGINKEITDFEDSIQALFDFRYMPIPFVSEHLLVFFIHVYLPIQTIEMGIQCELLKRDTPDLDLFAKIIIEIFGLSLALLANIGFQGLFAVGAFLEWPYGGKDCHSRVSTFCRLSVRAARKTLAAGSPANHFAPMKGYAQVWNTLNDTLEELGVTGLSSSLGIRAMQDLIERQSVSEHVQSSNDWQTFSDLFLNQPVVTTACL